MYDMSSTNYPNDCWWSVFQDSNVWLSLTSDFLRTSKQGTAKKEFLEHRRRERGKFGDFCEDFLPNRLKNDARFLNLLKISKFCPYPHTHMTKQASKWEGEPPSPPPPFSPAKWLAQGRKPLPPPQKKWGWAIKPCWCIVAIPSLMLHVMCSWILPLCYA